MTEQITSASLSESLSALMDNEVSELELQRLLKASAGDKSLMDTWSRYQLGGAALRKDLAYLAPNNFMASVSAALDAEEVHNSSYAEAPLQKSNGTGALVNNWWHQLGRVAIAASVAGALVVGVQQYQLQAPQIHEYANSNQLPAVNSEVVDTKATHLPSGINAPGLAARTVAMQSGYEARPQENRRVMFVPRQAASPVYNEDVSVYVNQLIEAHSDNASLNSGQGMLPFTRLILTEDD